MKVISKPKQPEHECDLPGLDFDLIRGVDGTVLECEECGKWWRCERWPKVDYGMQRVGNRWVLMRKPINWFWHRWTKRS